MTPEIKAEMMAMAKNRGMNIAEDAAQELMALSMDVVGMIVKSSENTYDDMIWAAIEMKGRELMKEMIDKIDGEIN